MECFPWRKWLHESMARPNRAIPAPKVVAYCASSRPEEPKSYVPEESSIIRPTIVPRSLCGPFQHFDCIAAASGFCYNQIFRLMVSSLCSFAATLQQRPLLLLVSAITAYLYLVSCLRYQRARSLEKRYSPAGRASFASMSTNDAQAIFKALTELEFPKIFGFSIIFAL